VLQLPLPSSIPFVRDAVDATTGTAGMMRSELSELYAAVGSELGVEANADDTAAATSGAAAAAVAAAGQAEQDAAYQAVKAALNKQRAAKAKTDWRQEHGLRLCAVKQQQLWCCKTCAARLRDEALAGGGAGAGAGNRASFAPPTPSSPRSPRAGTPAPAPAPTPPGRQRAFTANGSGVLWAANVLRFLPVHASWKKRYCEVTELGLNMAMGAGRCESITTPVYH
jgi:hypothetical protein